jgi:hypothetical protein
MIAQAIVERGMLEGISNGLARIKYAVEAQVGDGNAKWLLVAMICLLVFWGLRRRR